LGVTWEAIDQGRGKFILGKPVTCVIRRTAFEITFLEIKVFLLALSTKLWQLGVELLVACSKAVSVPTTDHKLSTRA